MKKFLLLAISALALFSATAQDYDKIKGMLILQQYKKAKDDLDKSMGNAKFTSKPEAYILKSTVYSALANEGDAKGTAAGDQLLADAELAFTKYREMDPSLALLNDPIYQNAPINIYSGLFSSGYKDYETKKYAESYAKFKKVVDYSDLLINKKVINIAADTNSLLLAGITAEQANMKDDAAKYYGRIADMKVAGKDYESIYRSLVNYHFTKKNMTAFEKYRELGKELYPTSEFFNYDKIDFAVGLEEDFNKKVAALEEVLAQDPTNYKANELLGEIIYDTLNSRREGAVLPANAAELEKKMAEAFTKAGQAKPDSEEPYIFWAEHFVSKAVKINDAREAHAADMKKRTKPGAMASKEDIAKRDQLDKQYSEQLELARVPYEKMAAVYAAKATLTAKDKQQYKRAASWLVDIYANKRIHAKGNAAEQAKFAAEEKKWNERYDSIK